MQGIKLSEGKGMERRKFGRTDMEFSVLGFGGAEIGYNPDQRQEDVDLLLNSALDTGLNVIDTAASYVNSEEMIGKAVGHRREQFYLLTKCGNLDPHGKSDWTTDGVVKTIETSLRRLKTDRLDLVQLHSCGSDVLRSGDAIEGLLRARDKGYTRYIGYSGDGDDARTAIELNAFDSLQTSINVADQSAISENIPLAIVKGLGIIAKRPIANAVWRFDQLPESTYYHEYWNRLKTLKFEFLSLPLEESIGTALRFTLTVPGVATAIVGTTKPSRWKENAAYALQGNLPESEFNSIRDRWLEVAGAEWVGQV